MPIRVLLLTFLLSPLLAQDNLKFGQPACGQPVLDKRFFVVCYYAAQCVHPNGDKEMFAFVLPNIEKPARTIDSYTFSVNEVQKLTGLNFFATLPAAEQTRLERTAKTLPVE